MKRAVALCALQMLLLSGCVRAGFSPDGGQAASDSTVTEAASTPDRSVKDGAQGLDSPSSTDGPVTVDGPVPVDGPFTVDGPSTGPTVKTFAGTGKSAHTDGPVASASFSWPTGLAWDNTGGLLVADQNNDVIRRIYNGMVATFAGTGSPGVKDGPVAKAEFFEPSGVAVDAKGDVFVTDTFNDRIRKISGGLVSNLAGTGAPGLKNGAAATARFNQPYGIVADGKGNIFVGDQGNHTIRRITAGMVYTFAGTGSPGSANGNAASAKFFSPAGVALDHKGSLLVADEDNDVIRRINAGMVSTMAGSNWPGHTDGPVKTAEFYAPQGMAVDATGKVFVADTDNNVIRMIHAGKVTTVAGTGTQGFADGPGKTAQFDTPTDVVVGAKGEVYVADQGNNRVRVISW